MALEFLKKFFVTDEEGNQKAMTFEELVAAVEADKEVNIVNLKDGGYVSVQKFKDKEEQVEKLQGQIKTRDDDIAALNTKLTDAQTDASKLADVQTELSNLRTKYDTDRQQWEADIKQKAYEYAVKDAVNSLKFTSPSAKRAFTQDAIAKGFQLEGDKVLGFDDYVTEYRTNIDPAAFVAEDTEGDAGAPETPKPRFSQSTNPKGGENNKGGRFSNMTLLQKMEYANAHPSIDVNTLFQ